LNLLGKVNAILVSVFAVALVPAGWLSYRLLEDNARREVLQNARLMMQTALAVRGYTSTQIQPLLAPRLAETFLPQSVPAYSATEVFNKLRQSHPEYTYKEATLNPTNLRDRTADWEADVVYAFRNDAGKTEVLGERDTPTGRTLFLARPLKITDANCLNCHTTPEMAPPSLVKAYGTANGFGWKLNEIIGAQIVSVPMSVPFHMARAAVKTLLVSLVAVFALTLVALNLLLNAIVIRPMRDLARMADDVSLGNLDAPEPRMVGKDEVSVLAGSFNRMRVSLVKAMKMLEDEER
jgi:protein-histidine pros-kinase